MGEMIRMTMSDGAEIAVYHALPDGARRGGLVLVQEIFGVTDHIRELCDEYAADGYEVLSPAIFDREHPGFEAAYTGPDYNRAVELARELHPFAQSLDDAQVCIDALKGKGPVFITGYCYGGSVAWALGRLPASAMILRPPAAIMAVSCRQYMQIRRPNAPQSRILADMTKASRWRV